MEMNFNDVAAKKRLIDQIDCHANFWDQILRVILQIILTSLHFIIIIFSAIPLSSSQADSSFSCIFPYFFFFLNPRRKKTVQVVRGTAQGKNSSETFFSSSLTQKKNVNKYWSRCIPTELRLCKWKKVKTALTLSIFLLHHIEQQLFVEKQAMYECETPVVCLCVVHERKKTV